MRVLLVTIVAVLTAATAFAGQNPDIRAFVTMDPAAYVHSDPDAVGSTIVNVYLCFDTFGTGGGLTGVSLTLDFECSGFVAGSADVSVFHPSAQTVIGAPDDVVNGWVVAAPECVFPGGSGIVCVGMVPWFYQGSPGDILILEGSEGFASVDCNNDIDLFTVLSNGAIGQEVPVGAATWSGIKALYR